MSDLLSATLVVLVTEQSISRGSAGRAGIILCAVGNLPKLFGGRPQRPDLEAILASGCFEECISGIAAFAAAGVDGLDDVNHVALTMALVIVRFCRQLPGAEARIRSLAPALKWCLEHDTDCIEQMGMTSSAYAAQICETLHTHSQVSCGCNGGVHWFAGCGVFGRDEGDSDFSFSQQIVHALVDKWSKTVRAVGFNAGSKPTASNIMAVELCISDRNKPLLLENSAFIPYLVDALLLVRRAPSQCSCRSAGLADHDDQLMSVLMISCAAVMPNTRIRSIQGQG